MVAHVLRGHSPAVPNRQARSTHRGALNFWGHSQAGPNRQVRSIHRGALDFRRHSPAIPTRQTRSTHWDECGFWGTHRLYQTVRRSPIAAEHAIARTLTRCTIPSVALFYSRSAHHPRTDLHAAAQGIMCQLFNYLLQMFRGSVKARTHCRNM